MSEAARNRKLALVVFGVPITVLVLMVTAVFLIMTRGQAAPRDATPARPATGAAATLALAGTEWTCLTIGGASAGADHPPTLAFGADGRVSGFGGVNRIGGPWEAAAGGTLRLGPMVATRMAGPPERMDLERRFLAALDGVDAASMDGPVLTLRRAGNATATFGKVLATPGDPVNR